MTRDRLRAEAEALVPKLIAEFVTSNDGPLNATFDSFGMEDAIERALLAAYRQGLSEATKIADERMRALSVAKDLRGAAAAYEIATLTCALLTEVSK